MGQSTAIKALSIGDERLFGGILVPFGDEDDRDLDSEWFDADTKSISEWFDQIGALPLNLDHDKGREIVKFFGGDLKDTDIFEGPTGRITKLEKRAEGWYAEGVVEATSKLREAYADFVWSEIQAGKLNFSSGAFPNRIKKTKAGYIEEWPVIEATATWRPAMPKNTQVSVKSFKSALDLLHIQIPAAIPFNEELEDGEKPEKATELKNSESIDEQSRRVYQAWDELNRRPEPPEQRMWIVERYDDYVIVCEGAEHYKVPYSITDDTVVFAPKANWSAVRREWVTVVEAKNDDSEMTMPSYGAAKALASLSLIDIDLELSKHGVSRITA